jgi:hypothetical protein
MLGASTGMLFCNHSGILQMPECVNFAAAEAQAHAVGGGSDCGRGGGHGDAPAMA